MGFFDAYSRYFETGAAGTNADLLNARHQILIENNRHLLDGARVLDIASHDGRWSFSALAAGAKHVTGIEARANLVDNCVANLVEYRINARRFQMLCGSVFEVLPALHLQCDTVLLFGFFYHLHQHVDLVRMIEATGARNVIVDTMVIPRAKVRQDLPLVMEYKSEPVDFGGNAFNPDAGKSAIVGHPSRELVHFLFDEFGYRGRDLDWSEIIARNNPELWPYNRDERASFVFEKRRAA